MTTVLAPVLNGFPQLSDFQKQLMADAYKAQEGKTVRIEIGSEKRQRSLPQNAWYHGVIITMIASESGHTANEVHEWAKATFLPKGSITIGGKEQTYTKSTTELSTDEFSVYCEHIRAFAATELGISIPSPDESPL